MIKFKNALLKLTNDDIKVFLMEIESGFGIATRRTVIVKSKTNLMLKNTKEKYIQSFVFFFFFLFL